MYYPEEEMWHDCQENEELKEEDDSDEEEEQNLAAGMLLLELVCRGGLFSPARRLLAPGLRRGEGGASGVCNRDVQRRLQPGCNSRGGENKMRIHAPRSSPTDQMCSCVQPCLLPPLPRVI